MSKRGMLDVAVGIEAIPAATMLRVDARCQELFGMDHEQLVGRMSEDLVAVAESGSQAYRDWYQHQHDTLAAAAKDAGPGDDIDVGIGTLVAMTAVTSGETGWEQNLKVATSIGGTRQPDGSVMIEEDQHPVAMAADAANQSPTKRGYLMTPTGDADADADRLIDAIIAGAKADKEAAAAKPQD